MPDLAESSDLTTWQSGDVDLMVGAAEAAVRAYCGWHIYPSRDDTVVVDGSGAHLLMLPTLHLTDVASVTETATFSEGPVVLDLTDGLVQWSANGYLVREGQRWTTRLRGVEADITHGYPDLPLDLQAVVLALSSRAVASPGGATLDQAGPFQVRLATNSDGTAGGVLLTGLERSVLDTYKIPLSP